MASPHPQRGLLWAGTMLPHSAHPSVTYRDLSWVPLPTSRLSGVKRFSTDLPQVLSLMDLLGPDLQCFCPELWGRVHPRDPGTFLVGCLTSSSPAA